MPDRKSIGGLAERWRSGDEAAAEELYRRHAERLCRLAEGLVGQRLGRRYEADDAVQSTLRSFFRRAADGQ